MKPAWRLLGGEIRVTAPLPDGTKRPLLSIDDWDFEWQLRYTFKKPVPLPGGAVVEVECTGVVPLARPVLAGRAPDRRAAAFGFGGPPGGDIG
jgi:hypothetical protein